jgi:multidrug efflux pump subunit AcrA (membrane-fusion protein)
MNNFSKFLGFKTASEKAKESINQEKTPITILGELINKKLSIKTEQNEIVAKFKEEQKQQEQKEKEQQEKRTKEFEERQRQQEQLESQESLIQSSSGESSTNEQQQEQLESQESSIQSSSEESTRNEPIKSQYNFLSSVDDSKKETVINTMNNLNEILGLEEIGLFKQIKEGEPDTVLIVTTTEDGDEITQDSVDRILIPPGPPL